VPAKGLRGLQAASSASIKMIWESGIPNRLTVLYLIEFTAVSSQSAVQTKRG
jgi:hypothetical protein